MLRPRSAAKIIDHGIAGARVQTDSLIPRPACRQKQGAGPAGIQGNIADPLPPALLDTDDPAAAIAAAVQALPPHYDTIWIGSVESQR